MDGVNWSHNLTLLLCKFSPSRTAWVGEHQGGGPKKGTSSQVPRFLQMSQLRRYGPSSEYNSESSHIALVRIITGIISIHFLPG